MAQWTNDRFVSTLYQVLGRERDGSPIAFFHQPNQDAVIECIDSYRGSDARYTPVTSREHRLLKVHRANSAAAM